MKTHSDIVAGKGASEIAAKLGVPAINVRMWKKRNVIPRSAWAELIEAYPDITLDLLKAARQGDLPANDDRKPEKAA